MYGAFGDTLSRIKTFALPQVSSLIWGSATQEDSRAGGRRARGGRGTLKKISIVLIGQQCVLK